MQLRDYQKQDVEFLAQLDTAGVFNEQRTGKTPTVLKTLEAKTCKKILIVSPASMLYKWQEEYETWLNKPCVVIAGTKRQREKALENWTDGAVISYGLLKNTASYEGFINEIATMKDIEAVVVDEAHRMKNTSSAITRALTKLRHIPIRYALTGTPAPNRSYEIFAILNWLYPKEYSSYWGFIGHYFKVVNMSIGGTTFKDIKGFKPGKEQELLTKLSQFCTQRKRKEVMPWLPEKDYTQIKLNPTKQQLIALKELADYFETGDVITQGVLDRIVRYRQICLHPPLLNIPGNSPKLDWIVQYLKDYPEKPVIIFSKFTSFLLELYDKIKNENVGVIIGETRPEVRTELVKAFQKGNLKVLLIQIDAGKEGLTLDKAEVEIFCDKYPPVGDIAQAEDRFIATDISKADKPHEIIELILKGTYDEQLYALVRSRAKEVDIINNFKKYLGGK